MSTSVRHYFIAMPIETVRSAWEDFLAQRGAGGATNSDEAGELQNVHLIPAEGGCFLATTEAPRVRRLARTCRALGLRKGTPRDEIEAFARLFTEIEDAESTAPRSAEVSHQREQMRPAAADGIAAG